MLTPHTHTHTHTTPLHAQDPREEETGSCLLYPLSPPLSQRESSPRGQDVSLSVPAWGPPLCCSAASDPCLVPASTVLPHREGSVEKRLRHAGRVGRVPQQRCCCDSDCSSHVSRLRSSSPLSVHSHAHPKGGMEGSSRGNGGLATLQPRRLTLITLFWLPLLLPHLPLLHCFLA